MQPVDLFPIFPDPTERVGLTDPRPSDEQDIQVSEERPLERLDPYLSF